jgi:hypothetical protein
MNRTGKNTLRNPQMATSPLFIAMIGMFTCLSTVISAQESMHIWVEGQNPVSQNMHQHSWYNRVNRDQLSGGNWISTYHANRVGEVSYEIEVPGEGNYRLWLRANPTGSRMSYRIGDGEWNPVGTGDAIDRINIAADGALDHRFIAWLNVGDFELTEGEHRISFRFDGGVSNSGGIDCFLLTPDQAYIPRGTSQPGVKAGDAESGFFAWEPESWNPEKEAVFDLRHLNEDTAGQNGFVRREGEGFVLGDGTPVRFWTVQGDGLQRIARDRQVWWAQRLAAYGVNLVRSGGMGLFEDWMKGDREGFERRLDNYHALVAALKDEGVYVYINHLFWNTHSRIKLPTEVFPGFEEETRALALLTFNEDVQDYYLEFITELMTTPNPYTGLSMAEDPTVAFVEIQNESSLLFNSFNPTNFVDTEREYIERRFRDWLVDKYGSLEVAMAAWGPRNYPHTIGMFRDNGPDRPGEGRMTLYGVAHMGDANWAVSQRNDLRAGDQLQFMIESQKGFYERMSRKLREVGVNQLISPSNWKTANERNLGALEHYTYTGADLIANNSYFGTPHEHNPHFYRVSVGDRYRNRSALTLPADVSALQHQTFLGYPYIITENNWNRPNRFRAEYPVLVSAYASLADIDGWLFFSLSSDPWDSAMPVWGINDTTVLGQFPATALLYRRGDVQTGETVVHEALKYKDLYAFKGQAMRAADGIEDPLYDRMLRDVRTDESSPSQIDPLAFYVGRVTRSVSEDGAGGVLADIRPYIDRENKTVRSSTDELHWDFGKGIMTINTPLAQGATGFLAEAGRIELADIVIESENEYGSILVISLDGKPLRESENILIQCATEDRPYGFDTEASNDSVHTIRELGGYPLNVRMIEASVRLKQGGDLTEAVVLDGNGYPTDQKAVTLAEGGSLRIQLPENSLYTQVR